ncbi:MAG: hypothetical protein M1298_00425, partial [Chloroflexi bacterium]|nr:hypothetical protein [Chloroflexota bacterium]
SAITIAIVHCEVGRPSSIEEALDTLVQGITTALTLKPDILLLGATAGPLLVAALLGGLIVHEALAGSPDARQWLSQQHHQLHPPIQRLLHTLTRNVAFRAELIMVTTTGFSLLLGNGTKDEVYGADRQGRSLRRSDFPSAGNQAQWLYTEVREQPLFIAPTSHFIDQLNLDNIPRIEETFAVLLPTPTPRDEIRPSIALPLARFNCIITAGGCWPRGYASSAIFQHSASPETWRILEMLSTTPAVLVHTWQPATSLTTPITQFPSTL